MDAPFDVFVVKYRKNLEELTVAVSVRNHRKSSEISLRVVPPDQILIADEGIWIGNNENTTIRLVNNGSITVEYPGAFEKSAGGKFPLAVDAVG